MKITERLLAEYKQMTLWHKIRLTLCINAMVFFTLASGYAWLWKMTTGLLGLHYGTTVLYANDVEMIGYLNRFWGGYMLTTMFYDLLVYFAVMFVFMYIGIKKRVFGNTGFTVMEREEEASADAERIHTYIDKIAEVDEK